MISNNPAADSSIGNDLAGTSKYIIIIQSTPTKHLRTPRLACIGKKLKSPLFNKKFNIMLAPTQQLRDTDTPQKMLYTPQVL